MSKYTLGPWTHKRADKPSDGEYDYGIIADVGEGRPRIIAEAFGRVSEGHRPNAEANARLISAAPEMLDALKALLAAVKTVPEMNHHRFDEIGVLVNRAIAKAEGK